jgi:drug/metabolite transporter (DMT)-like permease
MGIGVAIISFSAIAVRLSDSSPVTVAFFRTFYAVPILLILRTVTTRDTDRTRRQRLLAFGAGLVLALDFASWHVAIELIGAGLATVVGSVHVITTMLAGWVILKQRPTRLALRITPVVMLGVVLISGFGSSATEGNDAVLGVSVGVFTAMMYTTFLLLLRQSGTSQTRPIEPLLEATLGATVGALLLAPLDGGFSVIPSWPAHGWLLALALGAQVTGWLLITYVLPQIEAWETSMLLVMQPAGTILWAYLIFGEIFSISQWVGLCLVVLGVTVVTVSRAMASDGDSPRPVQPHASSQTLQQE